MDTFSLQGFAMKASRKRKRTTKTQTAAKPQAIPLPQHKWRMEKTAGDPTPVHGIKTFFSVVRKNSGRFGNPFGWRKELTFVSILSENAG